MGPVERIVQVHAPKAQRLEMATHLPELETLWRHPEVVALHDDDIRLSERARRALQNRQLEAVGVELEQIGAWQTVPVDLRVDLASLAR